MEKLGYLKILLYFLGTSKLLYLTVHLFPFSMLLGAAGFNFKEKYQGRMKGIEEKFKYFCWNF